MEADTDEVDADADFDPYENGDEPDASDDSDFNPSGGTKAKSKKTASGKKKKSKRGGESRRLGCAN